MGTREAYWLRTLGGVALISVVFFPQGSLVFVVFYTVFYGVPKLRMHFWSIF